jgi:hypothetical protein
MHNNLLMILHFELIEHINPLWIEQSLNCILTMLDHKRNVTREAQWLDSMFNCPMRYSCICVCLVQSKLFTRIDNVESGAGLTSMPRTQT